MMDRDQEDDDDQIGYRVTARGRRSCDDDDCVKKILEKSSTLTNRVPNHEEIPLSYIT